jgi:hypothetical protein
LMSEEELLLMPSCKDGFSGIRDGDGLTKTEPRGRNQLSRIPNTATHKEAQLGRLCQKALHCAIMGAAWAMVLV